MAPVSNNSQQILCQIAAVQSFLVHLRPDFLAFSVTSIARLRILGLGGKIGDFWDLSTLVLFGTKSQSWSFIRIPGAGFISNYRGLNWPSCLSAPFT